MVAAENLVVSIAETQWKGFNVEGCREVPSKIHECCREGVAPIFPDLFLTHVGSSATSQVNLLKNDSVTHRPRRDHPAAIETWLEFASKEH